MFANEAEVGREEFLAEDEECPAELADSPGVVAETVKEVAAWNIPLTQEFMHYRH